MCKYCDFNDPFDDMCYEIISIKSDLGVLGDLRTALFISVDIEEDKNQYKKVSHELILDSGFEDSDTSKSIKIEYCPFCGKKLESE